MVVALDFELYGPGSEAWVDAIILGFAQDTSARLPRSSRVRWRGPLASEVKLCVTVRGEDDEPRRDCMPEGFVCGPDIWHGYHGYIYATRLCQKGVYLHKVNHAFGMTTTSMHTATDAACTDFTGRSMYVANMPMHMSSHTLKKGGIAVTSAVYYASVAM